MNNAGLGPSAKTKNCLVKTRYQDHLFKHRHAVLVITVSSSNNNLSLMRKSKNASIYKGYLMVIVAYNFIGRATIDLKPNIRTAEENLIYYPKKQFFCLYNKLQIILPPFCMTDSFYSLFQIVTCVCTVEHCSAINRLSKASAPTTFYGT